MPIVINRLGLNETNWITLYRIAMDIAGNPGFNKDVYKHIYRKFGKSQSFVHNGLMSEPVKIALKTVGILTEEPDVSHNKNFGKFVAILIDNGYIEEAKELIDLLKS